MADVTIFHNPACGTSRNVLALLRHAGLEPDVARPTAGATLHRVRVRGRTERLDVYAVNDPRQLFGT
jgi:hypothetical protein